jgi:anti-sigma factor RsiW
MSRACAGWRDDIGTYILGALEPDESAQVKRHLEACPACRADYYDLLPVRDWLGLLAPMGQAGGSSRWAASRNGQPPVRPTG